MNNKFGSLSLSLIGLCSPLLLASAPALALDWAAAPVKEVPMFYAGQTGMEWMYDKKAHDGAARFEKRGMHCLECHTGDEKKFGPNQVGGKTDTDPFPGRTPFVNARVQAAFDAGNFYLRVQVPKTAAGGKVMDSKYLQKLTVMLDDGGVPEFAQGGCWAVCHQDSTAMPEAAGREITKYLAGSRKEIQKRIGGGTDFVADGDLAGLMAKGYFLEYWQARFNTAADVSAIDGIILKDRQTNDSALVTAQVTDSGADWVVDFSRPLAADGNHKALAPGKQYNIGLALHDQSSNGRFHIVSFEYSLTLGGDGNINAVKQ
ncbi:hypothetical protein JYB88_14305 [Shewanella cyperi]|uniref:Cytochrome c domain-containing protein n=1 Tax=Shewanella cyperi TaxID=2814292 RepID=A0A975AJK2_9GAMM|nr:ethylbenzene dehydrogenase-related protein [Shewanella cyperi]QSX29367.1 hypothetical protein JYB88_14305 [Shewanella cyperi]